MASISQTDAYTNTASQTTYTSGSLSIGSADSNRTIFVLLQWRGGAASVSSITIGDVAATLVQASPGTVNAGGAIYKIQASQLADPNSTTAVVSVTMNAAVTRGFAAIVAVTYDAINQTAYATATDQDTTQDTNSETATGSINIPAGGFALGIGGGYCETSGGVWVGLTKGTEYQVSPTSAETYLSPAYGSSMASETPRTITYTISTTYIEDVGNTSIVTASYAPADSVASVTSGSTAISVGASINDGIANSSSSSTINAIGAYVIDSIASSSGVSDVIANGTVTIDGIASAVGATTAEGISASDTVSDAIASSVGQTVANGVGALTADAIASATGANTSTATGASTADSAATSDGTSVAIAVGASIADTVVSSTGTSTVSASETVILDGVASATGSNTAIAVGASEITSNGIASASGSSTATALDGSTTTTVVARSGGGIGGSVYIDPSQLMKKVKLKRARKQSTHVIKVGAWPKDVTPVEVKKVVAKKRFEDEAIYVEHAIDALHINELDPDDEELMIILALAA